MGQEAQEVGDAAAVEEKLAVTELGGHCLVDFFLAFALDLEDAQVFEGALRRVQAIGSDEVALRVTFFHWGNMNAQALVDVLDWVDCVLSVKPGKEKACWVLDIGQFIQSFVLMLELCLLLDRLDNY